ncbi:DUF4097 family beta strand repeat-containing protein [Streptomyces sp. NPDC088674]|uniref:DUF4097 family beta strand repeat-containing protein n=1 Tax=Streptomyces sp. NPDC088674 TaxID=3365869 RepID=UPI00381D5E9F
MTKPAQTTATTIPAATPATTDALTTPPALTLTVDIPAGRLQVIATDRADAAVEIRPADADRSRDVKAAGTFEVTHGEGTLRVAPAAPRHRLLGGSGAVAITVHVPSGSHLEAEAASAELRGVGRLGDVTVEGQSGAVKLDETAGARITVRDGDLTIGRLGGPAALRTHRGTIRVAEAVGGEVTLRTDSGDIEVGAAPGVAAALDAETPAGRVHNALVNAARPTLHLHATTSHGDITATSL